jgi:serpin B
MTRWFGVLLAIVALSPLVARAEAPKAAAAVDSTAFFADLYAKVADGQAGNLFFSPTSIDTALAMTYAGAKGQTATQMATALHYPGTTEEVNAAFAMLLKTLNNPPEVATWDDKGQPIKKPAYQLVVANALWGQQGYPFQPAFTDLVQKSYGAGLNSVDYRQAERARTTINDWVAKQTKDKIKDLIGPGVLTPATRLVLTNAIYFKSNWADRFQKEATEDGPFKLSADKSVDVPMMHQTHAFGYLEKDDLQLLELPYTQGELSMVILLPKKIEGVAGLEKSLTAENLRAWFKDAKSESVEVTLPKFTFSGELGLASTLQAMGMKDAFDPGKADFSGMTSAERFVISAVIHKAFVAVDEEGTEAAAATAVVMKSLAMRSWPQEPKIFKADHPFVFLIRHNATGEILFAGRLANPKGE